MTTVSTITLAPLPVLLAGLGLLGSGCVLYLVLRWWLARRRAGLAVAGGPGGLEVTAVVLLVAGGFVFLIGWVVGCALLWVSPRWRWADKLVGTLVWPGGLFTVFVAALVPAGSETCSGGGGMPPGCTSYGPPPWAGDTVLVILLIGQIAAAIWLLRRAGRPSGRGVAAAPVP